MFSSSAAFMFFTPDLFIVFLFLLLSSVTVLISVILCLSQHPCANYDFFEETSECEEICAKSTVVGHHLEVGIYLYGHARVSF